MSNFTPPSKTASTPLTWDDIESTPPDLLDDLVQRRGFGTNLHKKFLKKALKEGKLDIAKNLARQKSGLNNQDIFLYACRNLPSEYARLMWSEDYSTNSKWKGLCAFLQSPHFEESLFDTIIGSIQKEKYKNYNQFIETLELACSKNCRIVKKMFDLDPLNAQHSIVLLAAKHGDADVFSYALEQAGVLHPETALKALVAALKRNLTTWAEKLTEEIKPQEFLKLSGSELLPTLIKLGHNDSAIFFMDKVVKDGGSFPPRRLEKAINQAISKNNIVLFDHIIKLNQEVSNITTAFSVAAEQNSVFFMERAYEPGINCVPALCRAIECTSDDATLYLLSRMEHHEVEQAAKFVTKTVLRMRAMEKTAYLTKMRAQSSKEAISVAITVPSTPKSTTRKM